MQTPVIVAFVGYVVLSVAGLLLLRANLAIAAGLIRSGELSSRPVVLMLVGAVSYAVSFALWLLVLANLPLSIAYPLAVGTTLAFSSLLAWLLLGERMTLQLAAGIVTVFVGVLLISSS